MGRADASCLSQLGHLSLKYTLKIQPLLRLRFPHQGDGADGGHSLAKGPTSSELCLSNLGPSPSLGSSCECPHAPAETDGDPRGLAEPSARTRHGHLAQGNTFLGAYMKNDHFFAFREKPAWLQLKYFFYLARRPFTADTSPGKKNLLRGQRQVLPQDFEAGSRLWLR